MKLTFVRIWILSPTFTLLLLSACSNSIPADADTSGNAVSTPVVNMDPQVATVTPTATAAPEPAMMSLLSAVVPTVPPQGGVEGNGTISATAEIPGVQLLPTPTPAADDVIGIVEASLVNVRSSPSVNAAIVGTVAEGEEITLVGLSADGDWYRVCCPIADGGEQWIAADLVAAAEELPSQPPTIAQPESGYVGTVDGSVVNVRNGPGQAYAIIDQVRQGERFQIVGRTRETLWWQICCLAEDEGWISAELFVLDTEQPTGFDDEIPVVDAPPLSEVVAEAPPIAVVDGPQVAPAPVSAPGLPGDGGFGGAGGTNPLTGLDLNDDLSGRRPLIVCINNDYAARPQLGIGRADVMYEYLMEGFGITRFSAVFYGDTLEEIGPVRSARLINYYMGALYNAGLACSGASDQVRYTLKNQSPFPYMDVDLDDPSNNRYSRSIGSDYRTRLRTSTAGLRRWLAEWNVEQPANVRGFSFGPQPGNGTQATVIQIPYPRATGSQVTYRFDGDRGQYLRSMGGVAHVDGRDGQQVAVENVIVQVVPHEITDIVEDSLGSKSIRLNLFGSGRGILFRDGQAYAGSWRSDSRGDLPRFFDQSGAEVMLKPGRTWISVVPTTYAVTFE